MTVETVEEIMQEWAENWPCIKRISCEINEPLDEEYFLAKGQIEIAFNEITNGYQKEWFDQFKDSYEALDEKSKKAFKLKFDYKNWKLLGEKIIFDDEKAFDKFLAFCEDGFENHEYYKHKKPKAEVSEKGKSISEEFSEKISEIFEENSDILIEYSDLGIDEEYRKIILSGLVRAICPNNKDEEIEEYLEKKLDKFDNVDFIVTTDSGDENLHLLTISFEDQELNKTLANSLLNFFKRLPNFIDKQFDYYY